MCPPDITVKQEEVEDILSSLSRSATPRGAKAKHELPEPPSHFKSIPRKSQPKFEDDDDDVLTSLCGLFDGMWQVTPDDDSDSDSDDSEPESPRSRNATGMPRMYFKHEGYYYFYDQDHNVFLHEGQSIRQIHYGRPFSLEDCLEIESIEGLPYYFGIDSTLCYYNQNTVFQVPVEIYYGYSQPPELLAPTMPFDINLGTTFDFGYQGPSQFPVSNGDYCSDPSAINSNPLNGSLQGQPLTWSPASSSKLSPIVSSGSRASSSEPFEPLISGSSSAWSDMWKQETKLIQEERNYTPPSKLERRRCKHCNKVFRRPSSLEDHLNVHSGAKPHMCPFERCNTGFATKSNMKRHFQTHRVGKLEEYCRRGKLAAGRSLTATYNAKAFHTQRFRLVPS